MKEKNVGLGCFQAKLPRKKYGCNERFDSAELFRSILLLWAASNYQSAEALKHILPNLLQALTRHGHLKLSDSQKQQCSGYDWISETISFTGPGEIVASAQIIVVSHLATGWTIFRPILASKDFEGACQLNEVDLTLQFQDETHIVGSFKNNAQNHSRIYEIGGELVTDNAKLIACLLANCNCHRQIMLPLLIEFCELLGTFINLYTPTLKAFNGQSRDTRAIADEPTVKSIETPYERLKQTQILQVAVKDFYDTVLLELDPFILLRDLSSLHNRLIESELLVGV